MPRRLRSWVFVRFAGCRGPLALQRGAAARMATGGLGLLALAMVVGCASMPQPRVPGPPVGQGLAAAAPNARAPRPTPPPEKVLAVAETDVVAAGEVYVRALYAADDVTAAQYQPGFGPVLRKTEDEFELLGLAGRPMSWGEAGYAEADPDLEWAEIVADVRAKRGTVAGKIYYKLGFKREAESLTIGMYSVRMDTRETPAAP